MDSSGHSTVLEHGLLQSRTGHTATVLPDGSVLIFGGMGSNGSPVKEAERYDPNTGNFSLISDMYLVPRAYHTATLLMDGRLLVMGGIEQGGIFPDDVQFWDYRTGKAESLHASLLTPRQNHSAVLLSDGRIFLSGGTDRYGRAATLNEIFDPISERFSYAASNPDNSSDKPPVPAIAASLPEDGSQNVSLSSVLGVRFSRVVDVRSITSANITLEGPTQLSIPGKVAAAEAGMLAFFSPDESLLPGSNYRLTLRGLKDAAGEEIATATISFTTEGVPDDSLDEEWIPTSANLAGNWDSGTGASKWQQLPPLKAPVGVTALAGQVLRLNGYPLANVTLDVDGNRVRSDNTGRFLISKLNTGHHVLVIDGRSANHGGVVYGLFEAGVDITAAATNVLKYTIWMTRLDLAHAATIPSPTTAADTVITTPRLPGLELHLPAGTVIRDHDGKPATEISITPVPLDKPPFPLPPGVQVPIYFTVQPGGAYIDVRNGGSGPKGARLIYPNTFKQNVGTLFDFWNYDADQKGWYVYGQGRVSQNGISVIPNPGVLIYELTGAMVGVPGNAPGTFSPCCNSDQAGDPVNLSTGLFVYTKTDLVLPDVIPLALTRTYRANDTRSRPFGIGFTHFYEMFLVGDTNPWTYQELILPDGSRVHFTRTSSGTNYIDAVYEHTQSRSSFYGATIQWNGTGWTLQTKDGTIYKFPEAAGSTNPAAGALIGLTDRYGNSVQITRDTSFNLTKLQATNGRYITVQHDSSNRITSATDNIGRTVQYVYDSAGNLSTVTDANGGVTTYTYDSNHNMLTITDARGIVYLTNQYDSNGRVVRQTQADGSTYQFAWTPTPNAVQSFSASSGGAGGPSPTAVLSFRNCDLCNEGYLPLVQQVDVTDPRGYVRRVVFGDTGYTTSDTRALNQPEQQTTTYEYYADNLRKSATDQLGRVTTYQYDVNGNETQVTRLSGTPDAVTTSFTYDATFNQLTSITDPLNHTTSLSYDSHGNLTTATDPLGHQMTMAYNSQGLPVSVADALSNTTLLSYLGGDLVSIVNPLNNTTSRFVDAAGRLISVSNPLGQTSAFQYDNLNQTTQVTDPLGQNTGLTYDKNGNLLTVTDALTHTTTYTYDNMDRVATRTDPLNRQESYTYDLNGNLSTFTDRKGQVTSFSYDGVNRRIFAGFGTVVNGGSTSYQSTINYTYDGADRLTQAADSVSGNITRAYDLLDRLTSETTPQGSISYTYDAANRRATMTVASQPQVTYSYDNANRLTQIAQGSNTVGFALDNANRRTSLTLPNGIVTSYSYDNASQLTGLNYQKGSNTLGALIYVYDALGRRTQIGGGFARTGLPDAVSSATYDSANELTQWGATTLSYDSDGNLANDGANTYAWNSRNQMSAISGGMSASFGYDAFGRRIGRNSTNFLYDGVNSVQELAGGSPSANILAGGIDENFLRSDISGTWNFLSDALGSTVALSDSGATLQTQYTYEPFGNTTLTGAADSNSSQYTGRENDGTGLYYDRARYYSPIVQRFISEDPAELYGGVNFYEYAQDSPTYWIDTLGLDVTIKRYPGNQPAGHIGLGVNSPGTVGFYPAHDTGISPGKVIPDDPMNEGAPESCIIIPTTPQQDQDILNFIKRRKQKPGLWRPGRDCANFVHDALKAGGIDVDDSTLPRQLMNNIKRQVPYKSCFTVIPIF